MYILQVIISMFLLVQTCYSRSILSGTDLGDDILFSWDVKTLSMAMSVKLPDTFKWIAVGFHDVPYSANYWEDLAMITIDKEGLSEVSFLKTLHWDEDDSIYDSDIDLYEWTQRGRQKSKHNYYFTIRRNLLDLPTHVPVKLMWAYGKENLFGDYPAIDRFKSAFITLDDPESLKTLLQKEMSPNISPVDTESSFLGDNSSVVEDKLPKFTADKEASLMPTETKLEESTGKTQTNNSFVPPSYSNKAQSTNASKYSVQSPSETKITSQNPTEYPLKSVYDPTVGLSLKVSTDNSYKLMEESPEISKTSTQAPYVAPKKTVEPASAPGESIKLVSDVPKGDDAAAKVVQSSAITPASVPKGPAQLPKTVDGERVTQVSQTATDISKPSSIDTKDDEGTDEVQNDKQEEQKKEGKDLTEKVSEKKVNLVPIPKIVTTQLKEKTPETVFIDRYVVKTPGPVYQPADQHGRAKPKVFSSAQVEKCGIDLCSYSRCPIDTICVSDYDHCTSSCKGENTSNIAECTCNTKQTWYSVFKNNENTVYFGVIGFSAFFTGLIVLCLACCCAKKARKAPRTRKNKVSFYKVNDFDSSADEEIEFLKENTEDAEDEVYTKH